MSNICPQLVFLLHLANVTCHGQSEVQEIPKLQLSHKQPRQQLHNQKMTK